MKTDLQRQSFSTPPVFFRALVVLAAVQVTSQAALLVGESFTNYVDGDLSGQAATGLGLTGNWASTTTPFLRQGAGLSMAGAYASPGSVKLTGSGTTTHNIAASFTSALPAGQLYGSYLFTTTAQADSRSVGLVAVGATGDTDGNASFVWAGNGYYSPAGGNPGIEGPGLRVEGSGWVTPTSTLNGGETYIMMFTFNATTGTTTAWVLNQAQLTYQLSGAFDSVALNLAGVGTAAAEVVWKGSVTGSSTVGAMSSLHLLALPRSAGFEFVWDEFRVSDASLLEAVTVPEPSAVLALGLAGGALALRRRRDV